MRRSRNVVQTLVDPSDEIDARVDAVELRLDLYPELDLPGFLARSNKPVIASARRIADGGRFDGPEAARRGLLRGAPWIDWELGCAWEGAPARRIVSFHDLRGMPEDLDGLFERCLLESADRIKIAVTTPTATEAFRLLELPCGAIGMGPYGTFTRVLAPLTYCAREPLAPGMPTPGELFETFRIARLGPKPALYGVAGDPIEHSRSPELHNAALERDGIDAVYLRFKVRALAPFWPEFLAHGGRGLSITAPLKRQAAALATRPSREVVRCGAANTLLADGRAYNTDYLAFLELVPKGAGPALILGAGGAARAALAALRELGYMVSVWARRPGELDAAYVERPFTAPVIVNTTPLDPPPAPILIDLRYGQGQEAGLNFLRAQARHQYRIFTNREL